MQPNDIFSPSNQPQNPEAPINPPDNAEQINQGSGRTKHVSKISEFFRPLYKKLALVLLLTVIAFGGAIYFYQDNDGTAKKSSAATITYDVILYDDTSAGVSALKAMATTAQSKGILMKVVWVKESTSKKAMAQNGLNIEDFYAAGTYQSGNVKIFRKAIEAYYSYTDTSYATRTSPYILADLVNEKDRQTYSNAAALKAYDKVISGLLNGRSKGVSLTKAYGSLTGFSYNAMTRLGTVSVSNGSSYTAKYFVDSSVEADLARKMGASYKLGLNETAYNDKTNPATLKTFYSSTTNTVPEAFTVLLNLQKYSTPQLYTANGFTPGVFASAYTKLDGSAYSYSDLLAQFKRGGCNITHMINTPIGIASGSTASSATNIFEFNQSWTDYRIPKALFNWYMSPSSRSNIKTEVQNVALHALRYLQENCSSVAGNYYNLPAGYTFPTVYARGEMRIVGKKTITYDTLDTLDAESVAIGYYNTYDRHLAEGQTSTYTPTNPYSYVEVPYLTMLPQANAAYPILSNLIVPTAISSDYQAYNSAIRMEMTRMNLGEAAGTAVALAKKSNTKISSITTSTVRSTLIARGVKVNIN